MKNMWKWLRNQTKKLWNKLMGSELPDPVGSKEITMNIKWNHIAGQWSRFHSKAKEQWDELTDNDLIEVNGHFEVLSKKIQEKYGIERKEARNQIDMWTANLRV